MSRIDELIGELCPDGVQYKRLGDLGRRNKGTAITAAQMKRIEKPDGPIRVFAGGQTVANVAEGAVPDRHVVRVPSIIVKSRGHIGFAYYDQPFTHKAELWSYSISRDDVDQRFVYYYLLTRAKALQEIARATSVKLPQLGVRDTDTLRIPIPPLEVQREIVRVLDTFTELEAELEARRRQYAHYRDALLTFPEGGVRWVPMGEVGEFIRGRRFTKADVVDDGIPSIHYGDIYTRYGVDADETVSHIRCDLASQLRFARPGDVVIAAVGETVEDVGKAVAWLGDTDVAIHDDCFLYRHTMNAKYISYYLQTAAFHSQKSSHVARAKVKRLSAKGLARITMPVPALEEQTRIVAILDKFDALVNDLSSGLPAEIAARRKQYEYYRDRLLTFKEAAA